MSFAVNVMQTLAAFFIFLAGYLVLLVAIICVVVLTSGIYKGGQLLKAYTVRGAFQSSAGNRPIEGRVAESRPAVIT